MGRGKNRLYHTKLLKQQDILLLCTPIQVTVDECVTKEPAANLRSDRPDSDVTVMDQEIP